VKPTLRLRVAKFLKYLANCNEPRSFLNAPSPTNRKQFVEPTYVEESNYSVTFVAGTYPSAFANFNLTNIEDAVIRSTEVVIRPPSVCEWRFAPTLFCGNYAEVSPNYD